MQKLAEDLLARNPQPTGRDIYAYVIEDLSAEFGGYWARLPECSRQDLVSGCHVYIMLHSLGEDLCKDIDFSSAIIPIVKACEIVFRRYISNGYYDYLINNGVNVTELSSDHPFARYDKFSRKTVYKDKDKVEFTLVVAQSILPNTELKLSYQLDSDGNEYDNLISHQSIEEILLAVAPIGENADIPALTTINVSPDRYTAYIYDYVGRTLAQCGYVSMAGKLMQQYGSAYVHLAVYAEDGSYVDIQDADTLKNYVVTRQSISPNIELKMVYSKDSDGNEYDNLIDTQNIEEIELYVVLVNSYTAQPEEANDPADNTIALTESNDELVDGMRPEFKEAMDAYEAFYDEYCAFMAEYKENPSDMTLLLKYSEMTTKVIEMDEAFTKWDDEDLNSEELKYYLEVNNRVMQKLIDVAG